VIFDLADFYKGSDRKTTVCYGAGFFSTAFFTSLIFFSVTVLETFLFIFYAFLVFLANFAAYFYLIYLSLTACFA